MSGAPSELRLATESVAGLRPHQEDAVVTRTFPDGRTLLAVADGMGGHAAGEVASALALETLVAEVADGTALDEAFRLANRAVNDRAREPGKQGMGTTMVAALLAHGSCAVANVGDSRAYVLTASGIRQVTEDHSYVAEAMKRGQSEAEALNSQWKNALTRSIGSDGEVVVDVFGPFPLHDQDALLLCSDGLYKSLGDDEIRATVVASRGTEDAARSLVAAALGAGSDDNVTVALAEFGDFLRAEDGGAAADEEPEAPQVDVVPPTPWWMVWRR